MIPERLFQILRSAEKSDSSYFPPTEVFNEGWMLRLVLDAIKEFEIKNEFQLLPNSRWYSEARLDSCFQPFSRPDLLAEGPTHADAVIGDFEFRPETKAGLRLRPSTRQFIVIEAKMFSNLSVGTKNVPTYNQAARNVACMATTIAQSGMRVENIEAVGFFVIAPHPERRQNRKTNLEGYMRSEAIRGAVDQRIALYEREKRPEAAKLRDWEKAYFDPLIDRLASKQCLKVLCWDDALSTISRANPSRGEELIKFYQRCLSFEPVAPL